MAAVILVMMVVIFTACQGESLQATKAQDLVLGQAEAKVPGQIRMVIATDIHHLATSLKDDGQAFEKFMDSGDGKVLQYTDKLMEVFAADVKVKNSDFVILSGDLTNNGEKASHEEMAGYLAAIEEAGIPVYVIPGNHDLNNPFALGFEGENRYRTETLSPEEFEDLYQDFGYGDAMSRDSSSLSYLAQPTEGLAVLMLDSNRYDRNLEIGIPDASGVIRPETLAWIREEVGALGDMDVIAVMHHNAMVHTDMFVENYVIDNSVEVMELFEELGIQIVLSGHIHIQDISQDESTGIAGLTTSSLSVYPTRFGLLTSTEEVYAYETADLQVEAYAKLAGWQDPNLLDFKAFTKEGFANRAATMFRSQVAKDLPEDQISQVVDVVVALNTAYFAGEVVSQREAIQAMEGFEAMKAMPNGFMKFYMNSILSDQREDNHWEMMKGADQ
jgi:3',5'-cyclic AMP phosphodiesterase CpdA